ncbi:MAG: cell envelope integrity protein CreD [Paludibacteraceae bacterium]|nr:cell envelope integrity protein CreD [Paludibacteraceae bacterium]
MMNENENVELKASGKLVSKLGLKCVIIAVIALSLLIPTCMVQDLIREREQTAQDVTSEVSDQWCAAQTVIAPCLNVSKTFITKTANTTVESAPEIKNEDGVEVETVKISSTPKCTYNTVVSHLNVLPHNVDVSGTVETELLKRSIYKVVTYNAPLTIKGDFELTEEEKQSFKQFEGGVAEIDFAVSNLKGITDEIKLQFGNQQVVLTPNGFGLDGECKKLSAKVDVSTLLAGESVPFSMTCNLKGSQSLNFVPVAKNTNVNLTSSWDSPSFNGAFLPTTRNVTADGFTSNWKVSYINRSYAQLLIPNAKIEREVSASAFGVDFILPVHHYQKCMRCAKYALLFIFLTFATFFFIEVLNKKSIHPVQYLFVGLALSLFYCLLLSFSEHVGFILAYVISTLMTIGLLTVYSIGILKMKKTSCYIGAALGGLYVYIFVLIQMETYALLAGSIGLFAILGIMMYFSQRINWSNAD